MKNTWLTLLGIWVCTAALAQQTVLGGMVTVQNSKYETGRLEPVINAQVEEDYGRSQATTTGADGAFRLPLVGIPEQESFRFSVRKSGLEVVNTDQLKAVAGQKDAVRIYMARPEYIADFRKKIYNVGKTESEKAIERKLSQLEKERAELQKNAAANADRIEALSAEIELAEARAKKIEQDARELAQKYERINLDDASEQYQQAFRLFQAGELDQALALLQNTPEQARKILEERERIAELYREAAARDSVQRQRTRETMQALRLKADLHRTRYEWDSVALAYDYLIRLDSTNAQNVYDYAVFLEDINRYDQALHWLATFNRMPGAEAWQVANAYGLVGQIHEETGNFSGAMAAYAELQRQYASLTTKEAQNDFYKGNLAISYSKLGFLYQAQGKFDTALVYFEKDLKLTEEICRDNPQSESLKNGLAISYEKLGDIYQAQGKFDTALVYFEKRSQLGEELYRSNPQSESVKDGLAISYERLGDLYQAQGKFDTALVYFVKEAELSEYLYRANPKSESLKNGLAISYEKLGFLYQAQGKFDTALVYFVKRSQLGEELYRDNPKSESLKNGLAISYSKLGEIYQAQGKFDTALVYFVKYNQLGEELYRANPQSADLLFGLGVSYYKLAALYEAMGQIPKAIAYLVKALPVFERLYEITGLDKYIQISQALAREIHRLKN